MVEASSTTSKKKKMPAKKTAAKKVSAKVVAKKKSVTKSVKKSVVKKTPAKKSKQSAKKVTESKKVSRRVAKTPAKRKVTTKKSTPPVASAIVEVADTPMPLSPVTPHEPSLHLPDTLPATEHTQPRTAGHLKTWMAAGLVTVGIVIVWAFSLQLRTFQPSTATAGLNEALQDLQVNEFMSDIQSDWSAFQENVINLEDSSTQPVTTPSVTTAPTSTPTTPTSTPTTDELNALFSEPTQ